MKRIVTIGGGHGSASLLRPLKNQPDVEIEAVVAATDNGGSSEIIRNHYEVIPPGDIRIVITALIPDHEKDLIKGMEFRIKSGNGVGFLDGHPVGNIKLLAYMKAFNGDIVKAIKMVMKECRAGHNVLPVTSDRVQLGAIFDDGTHMEGEGRIDNRLKDNPKDKRKIVDIYLTPTATVLPETKYAIANADTVVVCSGSQFTSIGANFCVQGMQEAILENRRAKFVYVMNLMTNVNETPGWSAVKHLKEIRKRINRTFDYVICNDPSVFSEKAKKAYAFQGAHPVELDEFDSFDYTEGETLDVYGHEIIVEDLVDERPRGAVRHSARLAEIIATL